MTEIAGEEVNLSTFKWNYFKRFCHLLLNPVEVIIEVQDKTNFMWGKNREDNNEKQKLCLYLATDCRSGSMGNWGTAVGMLQSYLCRDQFTHVSKVLQL